MGLNEGKVLKKVRLNLEDPSGKKKSHYGDFVI